jgi:hypothetical protein
MSARHPNDDRVIPKIIFFADDFHAAKQDNEKSAPVVALLNASSPP